MMLSKAIVLFVVMVVAKAAAMGGHGIPWSPWTVAAYVWQDATVAAIFGLTAWLMGPGDAGRKTASMLFWTFVAFSTVNIPIGRALGTALTWPMLRAARGALADSLLLHATLTNGMLMAGTVGLAGVLPRMFLMAPARLLRRASIAVAIPLAACGPLASGRVDTRGQHRHPVVALAESLLPRVEPRASDREWRVSPFAGDEGPDFAALRGTARGRNVVLVSLESTAAQYLPLYGGADDITPALTALATRALVFERAYAAYPESIKGLYSILCSTFPAFDVDVEVLSRVPCTAVPRLLREAGYATGMFHSGRFDYLGMQAVVDGRGYDTLEDAGEIGGNHRSSFGVDEPSTVARLLAWIDTVPGDQPFFVTYLPIAGHHPYETPTGNAFPDDDFGRYSSALRYGDASLQALADGLERRGRLRDTIWVIFGDHGEAFGQHAGNFGHTFFLYDENVRVPLVIAAHGLLTGQTRVRRPISLTDIAPTLLDLLGIDGPAAYEGRSALSGEPFMPLFLTDYSSALAGVVDGDWKAILDLQTGRLQLFDLASDAAESHDRSQAAPARAAWYADHLRAWSAAQRQSLASRASAAADHVRRAPAP